MQSLAAPRPVKGRTMQESGENYLETILILNERNGMVRSIDIANELGYAKPSVSRAVKLLVENGMLSVAQGGELTLTPSGYTAANAIYERHKIISKFFVSLLGVKKETADKDACRIEHVISEESFEKIKKYVAANFD